jgi:pimeloyl-ACP methyl ester carboxylesterase
MEKLLKIALGGVKSLYGKFQGSVKQPLFIIVHGLPCNMEEEFYHNATRYFNLNKYATFRFNLYDWRKDARQLIDCTLRIHADDIDVVVKYFRKKGFKKIFLAGHSFGGPSILLSKHQDFNAVALWDPSYEISFIKKRYGFSGGKYIKEVKGYLMRWGVSTLIGKNMANEVDNLDWKGLTKNFKLPILLILAGKGVLLKNASNYFKNARTQKKKLVIKGATHYFDDTEKIQQMLFSETKKWFDNF